MIRTMIQELARTGSSAILDEKQVRELEAALAELERRAAGPQVLDDRHVLCPVCNQVRGCPHLAAELEQLRAEVKKLEATRQELSEYRGVVEIARTKAGLPPKEREPSLVAWIERASANMEAVEELAADLGGFRRNVMFAGRDVAQALLAMIGKA